MANGQLSQATMEKIAQAVASRDAAEQADQDHVTTADDLMLAQQKETNALQKAKDAHAQSADDAWNALEAAATELGFPLDPNQDPTPAPPPPEPEPNPEPLPPDQPQPPPGVVTGRGQQRGTRR